MKILGLIPARKGSKGVPNKNIKKLNGRPLISYTIEAALESSLIDSIYVSTDSEEILQIAKNFGINISQLRPAEIAQDTTPMVDVIRYTLDILEDKYDAVCLLQPTSPFRKTDTIDDCIKIFKTNLYDTVITTLPVPHVYNPHWAFIPDEEGFLKIATGEKTPITRRQELPQAFHREGSVYITSVSAINKFNSVIGEKVYGYNMQGKITVNIDTLEDWEIAEKLITAQ